MCRALPQAIKASFIWPCLKCALPLLAEPFSLGTGWMCIMHMQKFAVKQEHRAIIKHAGCEKHTDAPRTHASRCGCTELTHPTVNIQSGDNRTKHWHELRCMHQAYVQHTNLVAESSKVQQHCQSHESGKKTNSTGDAQVALVTPNKNNWCEKPLQAADQH